MASNTCEELPVCTKFQSSFCSHCNRRLCRTHIAEHNKIISSITNLPNDINTTYQQIMKESEKRKNTLNNIFASFNKWRKQQIEKIDEIHQNHLKFIESERQILNNAEVKLFEQLEQNVRQPFEHLQGQLNVNMETIDPIQQTIKNVRIENRRLKCRLIITPPADDVEFLPLNISSISVPPKLDNKNSEKKKKRSTANVVQDNGRAWKRLVALFDNISCIEKSKKDIPIYLKNLGDQFRLPVVICSYLTAWYRKSTIGEKALVLTEHITIIQKYLTKCKTDFDVLIGIQAFFHNEKVKENKVEMMTFLLQFFLNHQCIDHHQIFNWYNNTDVPGALAYKGFQQAKHLATSFIKSLSTKQTAADQPVKMEIKETVVSQTIKMEIKEEIVVID